MNKRPQVRIIYNPRNRPRLYIGDYVYVDPSIIDYDELINKPCINGVELVGNLPITAFGIDHNDYATQFRMWVDEKFDLNIDLMNEEGEVIDTHALDLPIESVVVNADFDEETNEFILGLQNGQVIKVKLDSIIRGLVPESRTVAGIPLRQDISVEELKNKLGIGGTGSFIGGENPIGSVVHVLGSTTPDGYLPCDGSEYKISKYNQLAVYIAENFGSVDYFGGDGVDTFAVPNLTDAPIGGGQGDAIYCSWFIKYQRSVIEATIGDLHIEDVGDNISDAINNLHEADLLMQKSLEELQKRDEQLQTEIDNIEQSVGGQIYAEVEHKIGKWMEYDLYEKSFRIWNPGNAKGVTYDKVVGTVPENIRVVSMTGIVCVTRFQPWGDNIEYWVSVPGPLQYGNGFFYTLQKTGGQTSQIHLRSQYELDMDINFTCVSIQYIKF